MSFQLLLPDFLPPMQKIGPELLQGLELPALGKLVARGRFSSAPVKDPEDWLLGRYGLPAGSSAPYCLLAEGVEPGHDYWLHADPVHLGLQRTGLAVSDLLEVTQDEADTLAASLNHHFATDGLEFIAPHPGRWYAKSVHPLPASRSLAAARGGPAEHNPFPDDDGSWQRRLSEIQMLLHAHPINAAREDRGAAPINSLWLAGGGRQAPPPSRPFDTVLGNSLLALGLHQAASGKPGEAQEPNGGGETLAVEEGLRLPAAYGDFAAWREALLEMERHWFTPLLQRLEQNDIAAVALHFPDGGRRLDIRRADLWKIWRRRPLSALTE